ncbi:type I-D CRISPR-associated endonuclease Cas1d [Sphaerospermopsis kisseleviana CS-549]|uniref:CRISPR-associated endonuclease Cas1 n=2 Tax=Sphaerospermopsis TaxID=752201 RepID=A0A480A7H4_9CYAN|nr:MULTISPECIES: type I-D CRISPR-associated endonuclease Cas1d [Sphaerospermopsis]MBD2132615.1 type I-D CRISPR-associated endonuclease Cas1 [Sphaerospermopsis sp. FACHB-1094]MDB9440247.1 type I-D CRISPR-associated endonuclease Cas1d [Sphaerospermopsis kisseleviana CS-549]BAZ83623.1 CRISPR-associated protein Cas1 [Sphaerospermopsis kisseleviana NIES-73]GCL39141.1 CRISPR-associated protein Cas1 [Sphaerospermopsis reniformis]
MTTLYVIQPDAILSKDYEAFQVALKQEDGTWKKCKVAAQTVNEIMLMGNPQVTGDAFAYALELGMPIHYLSSFGKYLGSALPKSSRNGQLRLAQYQVYYDPVKRLELVKTIVTAKIHNQYHVLYRHNEKDNPLKERKGLVKNQQTLDQVRGVEGLAAREYFACWQNMVGKQWTFNGRNRRPPTDPVNSLLSFAYALLQGQVMAAVNVAGLDPYIGYLHEVHHGQPAMVLDLMEEFRALIADNLVLSVLHKKEIQPQDFNESLGAYRLKDNARKTFLEAFNKKMNDEFKHPVFDYRCTYRRGIELQARLLSRHLQEGVPYKPLSLR